MRTVAAVLVSVITILGLTGSPGSAAEEMGQQKAAKYYTKAVCPAREVALHWNKVIWKGRKFIHLPEIKRRLPELRRESAKFGRAMERMSAQLFNPPSSWPTDVDKLIDRYATLAAKAGGLLSQSANANTGAEWMRLTRKVFALPWGQLTAQIRARLNIRRAGAGC